MNDNKLNSDLYVYTDMQKLNKYIDPNDKVPEGYKKVIHHYYSEFVEENEPIAVTPYNSYTTTQINMSFKDKK